MVVIHQVICHILLSLPLWVQAQRDSFREYMMQNRHVDYKYAGKRYAVDIVDCTVVIFQIVPRKDGQLAAPAYRSRKTASRRFIVPITCIHEEKKRKRRQYSREYQKAYRRKHRPEIRRLIEGANAADKQRQIEEAGQSADELLHTDGTEQVAAMVAGENKIIIESSLPSKEEVKRKYGR